MAKFTAEDIKRYLDIYGNYRDGSIKDHVSKVTTAAEAIAKARQYKNLSAVRAAAVLHDIGKLEDPTDTNSEHHTYSAQSIMRDAYLRRIFKDRQIKSIANAALRHSSRDPINKPKTTLDKIINDADRTDISLRRAWVSGTTEKPHLTEEEGYHDAADYLIKKFGPTGHGAKAVFFPETKKVIEDKMKPIIKAKGYKDFSKLKALVHS